MMNNEEYIEKPEGKPVKAFRARVKMYDNDVVVVTPETPKESNRKMIKQKARVLFTSLRERRNQVIPFILMWMRTIRIPWLRCRNVSMN